MSDFELMDIDEDFNGVELCYYCGIETDFTFNPVKDNYIVCKHCGSRQMPCSLCDTYFTSCSGDCLSNIQLSLIKYNKLQNEV